MQDKYIDIESSKGDKLVVSLCCNYPFIKEALPADYQYIDVVEVSIDRIKGENSITLLTFQTIVHRIIDEISSHPEAIIVGRLQYLKVIGYGQDYTLIKSIKLN